MTRFERLFAFMIKPWVLVSYVGLIISSFFFLDRPIVDYFNVLDLKTNWAVFSWLTQLGSNKLYLGPLFILALFFRYLYHDKQWEVRSWFLWFCVLIPSSICLVLKITLGRARPSLLFDEHLYGFYGMKLQAPYWSFPSGHTTTAMGLVFGLCVLFPRYFYGFVVLGLMVSLSRIMLTEHYLSDVLAASYLTLIEVGLLLVWLRCKKSNFFECLKGR